MGSTKRKMILSSLIVLSLAFAGAAAFAEPASAGSATTPSCSATTRFLTFPAWYNRLLDTKTCTLMSPSDLGGSEATKFTRYILIIALNVIEIMLQLVVYLTVAFIIYGGILYISSAGSPDGIAQAQKTILNAIIGLVLALFAVTVVAFAAGRIIQ